METTKKAVTYVCMGGYILSYTRVSTVLYMYKYNVNWYYDPF